MPLDAHLMDRLFSSPDLPSLPAIALQIIEMVQEDEVDIDKIAETISLDAALSSKLLKTVNSSFYGLPKTVGSMHQAVVVLGLSSVKTLALGFSLVQNLTGAGGDKFDHMSYWRRSLYGATASKLLCEQLNVVQAEEVFMAALLQDVGVLALAQVLGDKYVPLMRQASADHSKLCEAEQKTLGGDHTEVGAALAESWGLPPLLVEAIRHHERPDEAPANINQLIRTVSAGGLVADLVAFSEDEAYVARYHEKMDDWFGMQDAASQGLLKDVFKRASEIQRLFDLPTGELADPAVILSNAAAVRERISQQGDEQVGEAEPQAQAPPPAPAPPAPQHDDPQPTQTDAVTGLPGREPFEMRLDELFITADADRPLTLIFVDLDHFKRINDALGQNGGDDAMRQIAEALRSATADVGELFRFDEDDFTLLCPSTNRLDGTLVAEKMRSAIEKLSFETDAGEPIAATASFGVATCSGSFFKRPVQLIKASRKGVKVAKAGGRNLVRVFVPKGDDAGRDAA